MLTKKENLLKAIHRKNPEWVPNGLEHTFRIYPPIIERPLNAAKDAFGCLWDFEGQAKGGSYPATRDYVITDINHWREQIRIPDVNDYDWSKVEEQVERIDREDYLLEGWCEMGLFERSYLLMGMDEALVNYMIEPDKMEEMISTVADYKISFIEKFDDVANLDMVWYGDDWGTQTGLFMSPEIWRRIIKPHTKRIYDCMKKRNIIINQHSCGKIDEIFEDMVEMGADIWNMCQPCNDLKGLKQKFGGSIAFNGGIDSQFVLEKEGVTPEDVRVEVRKRIDEMSPGGGYIAGPSHCVPYQKDLRYAMNDEIETYGKQIYQKR